MPEKQDRKDVSTESSPEIPTKAGSENAVADDGAQKRWSEASAVSHQNDQTPSRLDLKTANSPLELVDHTDTGSQRVLVSSAMQGPDAVRVTGGRDKAAKLSDVSRDDLARLSQNDLMAAGLLRDLDSAAHIVNSTERAERESQIFKLATQTYGKPIEVKESPDPTVSHESQHSEFKTFDTQQRRALSATNETARATTEMLDALNNTQLPDEEKARLRSELKSSFTEVADSAPFISGNGEKESVPHRLESGAFALGVEYETPPLNADDQLASKLGRFAEALYKNAVKDITDPQKLAQYWKAQEEKFIGIGMGLNEAKESMKHAAVGAFNAIADGSAEKFLLNSKRYEPLAKAAEVALQKMAENPNATNEAFASAMNALGAKTAQFSESYSKMTPQEQGRIIGNVMFAFINPEGSLEAPQLLAKAGARSEAAVAESFAAVMKSGTAEEIVQNLKLIRDLAKSPEMHQWLVDSIVPRNNGLQLAMETAGAPAKAFEAEMGSNFNAMGKWEDFADWLKKGLRGGKPSAAEIEATEIEAATAKRVSEILKLDGDVFVAAAVEHMVERPLQMSGEAFEHWQEMRRVLETMPEVDLRTSLKAGYKFNFPNTIAEADPVFAEKLAFPDTEIDDVFNKHMPAVTYTETKTTYIPRIRQMEFEDEVIEIVNAEERNMAGLVRHELGQQLCNIRSWITQNGLYSRFVTEKDFLIQNFEQLPEGVQSWIKMNSVGSDYVFEQVTTDLYALVHGGVGTESSVPEYLLKYFPRTFEHLKKNNWYR